MNVLLRIFFFLNAKRNISALALLTKKIVPCFLYWSIDKIDYICSNVFKVVYMAILPRNYPPLALFSNYFL